MNNRDYFTLLISMLPTVSAKCRNLTSGSIGLENSESEPIEKNCRFDHLSAKHFRFKDSAPEPIQRSVLVCTPFCPYKGKESDQSGEIISSYLLLFIITEPIPNRT